MTDPGGAAAGTLPVRGLIMTAPGRAELRELRVPRSGAGQVTVRIELCGVCTPEQRVFRGARPTYPYWGGHELCGIVEDGDGTLVPGTRVAVALMRRCGECAACRRGLDNHCAYLAPAVADSLPPGPRGFADRVVAEPYKLFPLSPHVPPERAALTEPIACCLRSVRSAEPAPGETALVLGAGTMGLIHTVLLARLGCRVVVLDDDPGTHAPARAAGAWQVGSWNDAAPRIEELTGGWGADAVFCTRGGAAAVALGVEAAARGGRVVLYQSIPGDPPMTLDPNRVHYRELRIVGSIAQGAADLTAAAEVLGADAERFDCLAVETVPAARGEEALRRSVLPRVNRVLIDFRP